jgi:hypothetical protein
MGMQRAIAAIELSLQNGWRGIFEPREQQAAATHGIGDGEQAKWK